MSCLYSSNNFQSGSALHFGVLPRAGKVLFRRGEGGSEASAAAASLEKKSPRKREKFRMEGADQPLSAKKAAAEQRRQAENRALAKEIQEHMDREEANEVRRNLGIPEEEQQVHDEVRAALAEARRRRQERQTEAHIDSVLERISGDAKAPEVNLEPPSEVADQVVDRILEKADVSAEDEQIDEVLDRIEKGRQKPVSAPEAASPIADGVVDRILAGEEQPKKRAFDGELSGFLDSLAAKREAVDQEDAFTPDTSGYMNISAEVPKEKPLSAIERLRRDAQRRPKVGEAFPAADLASPNFEIPKERVFGEDAEPEIDAALEKAFPNKPKNELPPNWREMFANQNEREGAGIEELDSDLLEEVDDEEDDIPEYDSELLQEVDPVTDSDVEQDFFRRSPQDLTPPRAEPSLLQKIRDSRAGKWVVGALAAMGLTSALNRDVTPAAQAPDRAVAAASKKAEAQKPVETPRRVSISGPDHVTVVPPAPSPFSPESVSKVQSAESEQKAPEVAKPPAVRRETPRRAEPQRVEKRSDAQVASQIEMPPSLFTLAPDFRGRRSFVEGNSLFKDLNGSVVEVKFEGGRPKEILIAPKDGGQNGEYKVETNVIFDRSGRAFSKGKRAEAFDGLASRAQSEFNRLLNL